MSSRPAFSAWRRFLPKNPWVRRPLLLGVGLGACLTAWVLVVAAQKAAFFQRTGLDTDNSNVLRMAAKEVVNDLIEPVYHRRLLDTTDLPVFELTLSQRRLDEWHGILDRVTERGKAQDEDRVYIPGRFHDGDTTYEVDIRGRGTLAGHYRKAKPSIRVQFPRDRYFEGDRVVNFIIPYEQTRVVVDTTLNEIARHYGLLAYPRQFAVLRLNGRTLGVYQRMEHFRKEMAVKQHRSEGFFVSSLGEGKGGSDKASHLGFRAAVQAMAACTRGCSPDVAEKLLDLWLDEERLATYAALTTWFYSDHAWGPDNLIFFFDPGYGRLEPIPWDVGTLPTYFLPNAKEHPEWVMESTVDMGEAMLGVPRFRQRRNEILWDMVDRKVDFAVAEATRQFDHLSASLDYDLEYSRRRTQRFYDSFIKIVRGNAELVRTTLAARDLVVTQADLASDQPGLRLINWSVGEAQVEQLRLYGPSGAQLDVAVSALVPGRHNRDLGVLDLPLDAPLAFEPQSVDITAHHHLSDEAFTADDVRWQSNAPTRDEAMPDRPVKRAPPRQGELPLLLQDPAPPPGSDWSHALPLGVQVDTDGTWRFGGTIRLRESVIMPDGVPSVFEPGLRLQMDGDVTLLIRGHLDSLGSAESPIVIEATDPERPFDSLAVLGRAHRPVQVRATYTTVDGGQEADVFGVHFSGMFSIYGGDLDMRHSRILNAAGEDGLNVKYGSVQLHDMHFEQTWGDALDLDFCDAQLSNNAVHFSGGDGFDFSGSSIEVRDTLFQDLVDKGLSIGENSQVVARGNIFRRVTTGVAVKDLSLARLEGNQYFDLEVGIAVYQKKQVFGSGTVSYAPSRMEGVATESLLDPLALAQRPAGQP